MCFRVHTTLERFSLSVSEAMEVCTSNTPSPQVQPMEVCVCALRFRSLLVRLALDSLLHTLLTFIECMLIQSIRCQKNRPCVCVCVWIYVSLSPSNGGVCAPSPSPSLIPSFPFPIPFSLFFPIPLSLSLYVVLPHVSYPTFTCFSHPISICGHRTVKAPYPVRSAKLSTVSTS